MHSSRASRSGERELQNTICTVYYTVHSHLSLVHICSLVRPLSARSEQSIVACRSSIRPSCVFMLSRLGKSPCSPHTSTPLDSTRHNSRGTRAPTLLGIPTRLLFYVLSTAISITLYSKSAV